MRVAKLGVLGSGSMGSGIAALAASAGVPVVLLDVPGQGADRNSVARDSLARAAKAKPAPFMDLAAARLIQVGNFDDNMALLADCDLIVEAIIEEAEPKRALFEHVEQVISRDAIVASNTSGIPIASLGTGRSETFQSRFLGTHFFNPPRYLHLLEIIPTAETTPNVVADVRRFAERVLGKGIVVAKDVPGFIANRLGIYGWIRAMRLLEQYDLTIDEADALTGTLIGRASSATFRTADISGLDVIAHVTKGLSVTTGEDFELPTWVQDLVRQGRLGAKTGVGFYRREGKAILTLDWKTGEYKPQAVPDLRELAHLIDKPLLERLGGIIRAGGKYADYLRALFVEMSHYTIAKTPEIAHNIVSVDRAMEWGYAWEIGPFRQMDALGMSFLRSQFEERGLPEPALARVAQEGFYRELRSGPRQLTLSGEYAPIEPVPDQIELGLIRRFTGAVAENDEATLLDIGDGVLLLEFRGKMNAIGDGVLKLLDAAEAKIRASDLAGLVIGNTDARVFSAGANLLPVARRAAAGDWDVLDTAVRAFQRASTRLRQLPFPVVVAPFGLTLGGAAEFVLHASQVQAHAELYIGLVEVGVGLIPAGGGTKELLRRFTAELSAYEGADLFDAAQRAFKLISMGTTATSAAEARRMGFLRESDHISMNRDRLLHDAKNTLLSLADNHVPVQPTTIRVLGKEALGNLHYGVWAMREAQYITDHEAAIGRQLAYVLSGGDGPAREVSEQELLDFEREAFLSLLGTKETQERIAHMLKTGKPLRN
ncbi:MAG: 3-hydroxyacyl-CoA dehydrogenase/enoyl-CoA hydratase family protein [Gemmatimonadaceae bacterium]